MARRVFFSFEYEHDVSRAFVVRNSWVIPGKEAAGFVDSADFEKVKKRGNQAVERWIDNQLVGTSVTVVLVGSHTCDSKWVRYEIEKSKKRNNGLLGTHLFLQRRLYPLKNQFYHFLVHVHVHKVLGKVFPEKEKPHPVPRK